MTGPGHYAAAERLLEHAAAMLDADHGLDRDREAELVQRQHHEGGVHPVGVPPGLNGNDHLDYGFTAEDSVAPAASSRCASRSAAARMDVS